MKVRVRDKRQQPFFIVYNDLVDCHLARMGMSAYVVYTALCRFGWNDSVLISYTQLARRLGIARSTLWLALSYLERERYITVEREMDGPVHTANTYFIEELPELSTGG